MLLVLEIISPEPTPAAGGRHTFGREGGTIGRGPRNSWVLTHGNVSGVHARISFNQSVFYIEDTSLNGVFVNSLQNRLVRGQPYALASGDRILIEPYTIQVSIVEDLLGADDPFAHGAAPRFEAGTPKSVPPPEEVDPVVLLGGDPQPRPSPSRPPLGDLGPGSPLEEHFRPPPRSAPPSPSPPAPAPARGAPMPIPPEYDPLGDDPPPPAAVEIVECTVFAPPAVAAGTSAMIQVFAHLAADAERVTALAREYDEESRARGSRELDREVRRGSELAFALSMPGGEIDEPVQTLMWRGRPDAVQFGVTVPLALAGRDIVGTVYVSQDRVPFGHVKFVLRCRAASAETLPGPAEHGQPWKRYEFAFISYASPDRPEVLKRVQMLARCRIDFFQDVLMLEPGERWQRALYKMIDRSDVVFLFWSKAASDSEWVRREIQYALARKAGNDLAPPEIVPIIIEGPPPVAPPPELASLHFNDPFLYFIAGS